MIELQSFLARLYTDDVFRMLNRIDPAAAQSFFELDEASKATLRGLDLDDIDSVSRGLTKRSFERVQSLFPVTCAAMGDARFASAFARFRSLHKHYPGETKAALVTTFGLYIEDFLRFDASAPEWHAELARYEHTLLVASIRGEQVAPPAREKRPGFEDFPDSCRLAEGVEIHRYEYDVVSLLALIKEGGPIPSLPRRVIHVVTSPRPGSVQPRVLKIPAQAAELLCWLRMTSKVRTAALASAPPMPAAEIGVAMRQFVNLGLVTA